MYLATLKNGADTSFQIRTSYQTGKASFGHRTIFDLGCQPKDFIKVYEDHIALFDEELLQAVSANCNSDGESLLEQLLWNFLPDERRRRQSMFASRTVSRHGPLTENDREKIASQIHLFDRRRLYYLRYGAVDQSRLSRLHEKCCRPLLGQSRDEREFYFAAEEQVLEPGSYLQYVYAIFNLQRFFHQSFAPWLPEGLALDEMADYFLQELCLLNQECSFWQTEKTGDSLHYHLQRYLIMFFDYRPATRSFFADFAKKFMADHRTFRWPERKPTSNPARITELFDTSSEELERMNREQLNKLYRQKAMNLHPDQGGDHELFIELTDIYNQLLRTK